MHTGDQGELFWFSGGKLTLVEQLNGDPGPSYKAQLSRHPYRQKWSAFHVFPTLSIQREQRRSGVSLPSIEHTWQQVYLFWRNTQFCWLIVLLFTIRIWFHTTIMRANGEWLSFCQIACDQAEVTSWFATGMIILIIFYNMCDHSFNVVLIMCHKMLW